MNSKIRTGLLVIEEEKRLIVGKDPFLVANLVSDFSVTYDAKCGVETLSYIEPRGARVDIEGSKVLRNSPPFKASFEFKRQANW